MSLKIDTKLKTSDITNPLFAFFMALNIATISDIARHAGVGTATVDRVLNKRAGVNAETTQKVMDAINALGEPTVMRGRPRQKSGFRFAYVLPEAQSPF